MAFSRDGHTLAAGSSDGTAQLWDARTQRPLGSPLAGHTDRVTSVAFSPDGDTLATGSEDDTIRLWRQLATHGQIGSPLTGHTGGVTGVAFSQRGGSLASSSDDGTVRLWDLATRRQIGQPLSAGSTGLSSVAFGPDGVSVVAGALDNTLWLWQNVLSRSGATLRSVVCRAIGSDLSRAEWEQFAPGLAYPARLRLRLSARGACAYSVSPPPIASRGRGRRSRTRRDRCPSSLGRLQRDPLHRHRQREDRQLLAELAGRADPVHARAAPPRPCAPTSSQPLGAGAAAVEADQRVARRRARPTSRRTAARPSAPRTRPRAVSRSFNAPSFGGPQRSMPAPPYSSRRSGVATSWPGRSSSAATASGTA